MAQQRSFNQDDSGAPNERSATALSQSRGTGGRAASFIGGDIDPSTGNIIPGNAQQVSKGFTVTGTENPAPPVPEPSRIEQIQPDPAPQAAAQVAPTEVAAPQSYGRNDRSNVVEQVGKWFCYGWNTPILLENGKWKPVQELTLHDRVKLGGQVVAIGQAKGGFTFSYKGQFVSGNHAVFEDGRFIRVRDSALRSQEDEYRGGLYPVATEHHVMVTPTHIAADFTECDGGEEMTPAKRLEVMNGDRYVIDWLTREQSKLFSHEPA